MKPFYVSALFLACMQASSPSFAILGQLGGRINDLPNRLDPLTRPITRPLEDTLRQVPPSLENLNKAVERLEEPLQLPKLLPILNVEGKTAFVDVEVEQGWRAVEREWLVMLEDKDLPSLQALGVEILEQTHYEQLGMILLRFKVTPDLDSLAALRERLPTAISARMDRNHIYASQAKRTQETAATPPRKAACNVPVSLGMIDTAINLKHSVFISDNKTKITTQNFLADNLATPDAHGTAVASILIGKDEQLKPLLPKANLFAASVFFERKDYAQGSTLLNLIGALNWMASQKLSVINMSLAGPDNQILAKVIEKILAKGFVIVAAAGNEGPAAPPVFPAAYPGVIAVTAADNEHKIYRWANQGSYISFAALGVGVPAARTAGGLGRDSGTSMAAPVVSAFMACELAEEKTSPAEALAHLIKQTEDLGEKGRDAVFGYGLL